MRYCAVLGGIWYWEVLCGTGRHSVLCGTACAPAPVWRGPGRAALRMHSPGRSRAERRPGCQEPHKISDDHSCCCTKACTRRTDRPARESAREAAPSVRCRRCKKHRPLGPRPGFHVPKTGLSLVRHRMRCARAHVRARARGAPPKEILLDEPNLLRAQRADRLVEISAPRPRVVRSWRACAHHNHESQGRSPATRRVCARA
jgi:hypothetical protein